MPKVKSQSSPNETTSIWPHRLFHSKETLAGQRPQRCEKQDHTPLLVLIPLRHQQLMFTR